MENEINASSLRRTKNPIAEVLISGTPSEELGTHASVYGWLVGSWDVVAHDYEDDGAVVTTNGEWHFNWVLEGRAIQDVWIAPKRSERNNKTSKENNRYGTSIRIFHPVLKQWKVYWHNPVSGVFNELTAVRKGTDIIQEGEYQNMNIRWTFKEITIDSFHWVSEHSTDKGNTWITDAEFFAKRMK